MKKALVIYNPVSGMKRWRNVSRVCQEYLVKHEWKYDWFETLSQKKQPLERFDLQKYNLILVAGGDGTIREVAEYMVKQKVRTPLSMVPLGTANMMAVSLGISLVPELALRTALKEKGHNIDVGLVNDKHCFFLGAGQGYDAYLMRDASREMKKIWGFFAYLWSFLKHFFTFGRIRFWVEVDGKGHYFRARSVLVVNMVTLWGWKIGPDIDPRDGKLNVVVTFSRTFWDGVLFFWKIFRRECKSDRNVVFLAGRKIVIKSIGWRKGLSQLDGDVKRWRSLKIRVLPKALRVVCKQRFVS